MAIFETTLISRLLQYWEDCSFC